MNLNRLQKLNEELTKILTEGTYFDYEPDADDLMADKPSDSGLFDKNSPLHRVGTFAHWFGEDLTGKTYEGDIDCAGKKLTSLKGAPKEIKGSFDCSSNPLTSLEGAPQKVDGTFYCFDCRSLISLEGAPQEVGGGFNCIRCSSLTSLEGAPQEVGGDFSCSWNHLTTLKGAPQEVGGRFKCDDYLKEEAREMGYKVE